MVALFDSNDGNVRTFLRKHLLERDRSHFFACWKTSDFEGMGGHLTSRSTVLDHTTAFGKRFRLLSVKKGTNVVIASTNCPAFAMLTVTVSPLNCVSSLPTTLLTNTHQISNCVAPPPSLAASAPLTPEPRTCSLPTFHFPRNSPCPQSMWRMVPSYDVRYNWLKDISDPASSSGYVRNHLTRRLYASSAFDASSARSNPRPAGARSATGWERPSL